MANDYKRMWTKEEIKSNSVLELPDIPEVVDANSPDIIRVQGKLYYKTSKDGDVADLTGTKWLFNDVLQNITPNEWYINFVSYAEQGGTTSKWTKFSGIRLMSGNNGVAYEVDGSSGRYTTVYTRFSYWYYEASKTIEISGGDDVTNVDLITFLKENAILLEGGKTTYNYKELGVEDALVKSIATDVSIIEDQGKLELMLEHDGNVLAVNDTPNQFLQRRLDKPSAVWDASTSETDFETWYENNRNNMYVGQIIELYVDDVNFLAIIRGIDTIGNMNGIPLTVYADTDGEIVLNFAINPLSSEISFGRYKTTNKYFSWQDVISVKLY